MPNKKPAKKSVMKPRAPRCARKHPALTKNRHVNEHLTFCALHKKAACDKALSKAQREAHKEAARLHFKQAAHHFRTFR